MGPLVIGSDVSLLLGAGIALRQRGPYGLQHLDGTRTSGTMRQEIDQAEEAFGVDFAPLMRVAREQSSADPAHDFLHVQRAWNNAQRILHGTPADVDVVGPAILLHELFNYPKDDPRSPLSGDVCAEYAEEVLARTDYPREKRGQVLDCIRFHSFSRGVVPSHIEGKIVQDADRLDALGAIGIARLFATGALMKIPFYHATDPFAEHREWNDKQQSLDHVYTKLLKLADTMHTPVAKAMAVSRMEFVKQYVRQLQNEI